MGSALAGGGSVSELALALLDMGQTSSSFSQKPPPATKPLPRNPKTRILSVGGAVRGALREEEKLLPSAVTEHWDRLPRELVGSPSPERFQTRLDVILCDLLWVILLWVIPLWVIPLWVIPLWVIPLWVIPLWVIPLWVILLWVIPLWVILLWVILLWVILLWVIPLWVIPLWVIPLWVIPLWVIPLWVILLWVILLWVIPLWVILLWVIPLWMILLWVIRLQHRHDDTGGSNERGSITPRYGITGTDGWQHHPTVRHHRYRWMAASPHGTASPVPTDGSITPRYGITGTDRRQHHPTVRHHRY
ncbi:integrator complex subunit 1 [Grus japonensis]|uniref:Integrator complex subunit 1 n=1 Tax=Grus japonensis TaxID=30415 RepID=A0ABC9XWL9_GRUJA